VTDIPRRPAGLPTGGQFAPTAHPESVVSLVEPADTDGWAGLTFDEQIASDEALAQAAGVDLLDADAPWSWAAAAHEIGEAHARELYDRTDGSLGAALAQGRDDWMQVTHSPAVQARIIAAGLKPSDFSAPQRAVRRAAATARGDLVFEDELLPAGYALAAYGPTHSSNRDRVVHPPPAVSVSGSDPIPWDDLSWRQQLVYVQGYAAGVDAIAHNRERAAAEGTPDRWDRFRMTDSGLRAQLAGGLSNDELTCRYRGWERAVTVARFEDLVDAGRAADHTVRIVRPDAVGGSVDLVDPIAGTTVSQNRRFRADVAAGQRRWDEGAVTAWPEVAAMFSSDQVLDWRERPARAPRHP